jgi:hypothetical protein
MPDISLFLFSPENTNWQGDFLSLARSFSWMNYAGAENRKGAEESY